MNDDIASETNSIDKQIEENIEAETEEIVLSDDGGNINLIILFLPFELQKVFFSDDSEDETGEKAKLNPIAEESLQKKSADENSDEDSDSDDSAKMKYPDTHIKVEHDTGKIIMQSNIRTSISISESAEAENENVIYLGDDKPVTIPMLPKKKNKSKKPNKNEQPIQSEPVKEKDKSSEKQNSSGVKRGQHSKLKKIKEKYKDQDDEDRAIFMETLKVCFFFSKNHYNYKNL